MLDKRFKFSKFFFKIFNFQMSQAFKLHVYNCLRLYIIKLEPLDKSGFCIVGIAAAADDSDNFVYVVDGNNERFQYMGTGKRFCKFKLCPARYDLIAVLDKILDELFEIEHF